MDVTDPVKLNYTLDFGAQQVTDVWCGARTSAMKDDFDSVYGNIFPQYLIFSLVHLYWWF